MVGHAEQRGDRIKLHFYLCEKCDLSIIVSELSSDWTIIPRISAIGFFDLYARENEMQLQEFFYNV